MKRIFSLLLTGLIGAAIAGCEASARIDDDDDTEYKKTTTIRENDDDRTRTTETEIRRDD